MTTKLKYIFAKRKDGTWMNEAGTLILRTEYGADDVAADFLGGSEYGSMIKVEIKHKGGKADWRFL